MLKSDTQNSLLDVLLLGGPAGPEGSASFISSLTSQISLESLELTA